MRLCFLSCIALVSVIQAIPFAPAENSFSDDKEILNLKSNADEVKPDLCLSELFSDENSDNSDNNQLEGLLRRENRKAACPSRLDGTPHSINTQLGGTDPNQLNPQKPKNPCAEYGSYKIGTCGGPAYGLMTDGSFYSVFNCIKGVQPVVPARIPWKATDLVDGFCCLSYHDESAPEYEGDFCIRVTFTSGKDVLNGAQVKEFRFQARQEHPSAWFLGIVQGNE